MSATQTTELPKTAGPNESVVSRQIECEICGSAESPRMAPVMTGVGFNAPFEKQRFVCGDCFYVWYEYGATTYDSILEIRKNADGKDKMLKPLVG